MRETYSTFALNLELSLIHSMNLFISLKAKIYQYRYIPSLRLSCIPKELVTKKEVVN